ncbi:MAG: carboxypeptidase-like regulatory domain-containing protein [Acidobacteriaceae bacterium]
MRSSPRLRLPTLALPLLLLAGAHQSRAAELPASTDPQPPAQTTPAATASIAGFIADKDNASIPGARITLTRDGQPPVTVTAATDGSFTFPNLPPGPFQISIVATGFAPQQTSGILQPGESLELPTFALAIVSSTNIEVTATPADIAEAQVKLEEKQRVLGAIPNFYVVYDQNPLPLDPRQKSQLALRSLIDPVNLVLNGATAGVQQATDTFAWQQGAAGYAKRYAAVFGTDLTSTLLSNAILPILFHQDPRYYYKGTGSIRARAGYAIANAVICKGDNGRWQPNYSGILGGLAASGISNAYYPAVNRAGAGLTFENAAIGTGLGAIANLFEEFVVRKLTPRIPPIIPPNP